MPAPNRRSAPSRRVHARFSCNIQIRIFSPLQGKDPFKAEMLNLGIGGALLCVRGNLRGPYFHMELPYEKKTFKIKTRIAHTVGRDPHDRELYYYGMQFDSDLSNEHLIRRLIDSIRSRGLFRRRTGDKTGELKRDYWNL